MFLSLKCTCKKMFEKCKNMKCWQIIHENLYPSRFFYHIHDQNKYFKNWLKILVSLEKI